MTLVAIQLIQQLSSVPSETFSTIYSQLQRQLVYLKILLFMPVRIETNQRFASLYKFVGNMAKGRISKRR